VEPRFEQMGGNKPERRAMSHSDTAGGYTVPDLMYNRIVSAMARFGGMRRANTTKFTTTGGEDLAIPTDNDTSNTGALLSEGSAVTEQDITVGQAVLHAYQYTSKLIRVQIALLEDSAFDLETWLLAKFGNRLGRIQNTHFTTGDAASKPSGVVVGATLGVTTAAATAITFDELTDLEGSVDADYRENGAQYMMADTTLTYLKKIKDGDGRPIWQPNLQAGQTDRINGYPFIVNNDVAAITNSAKTVLFGDFSNYFIRDVRGIQVLRLVERYAEYRQIGFLAFARADAVLVDAGTHPIKYLQQLA
jgi:HK97 family phage major capsid protein